MNGSFSGAVRRAGVMLGLGTFLEGTLVNLAPGLLKALAGYEDENARRLRRIESMLDALTIRPYREAERYLESASLPNLPADKQRAYVHLAIEHLRTAEAALSPTHHWRLAYDAQLTLAGLYLQSGSRIESDQWARLAYQTAVSSVEARLAQVNRRMNLSVGRIKILGLLIPTVLFALMFAWIVLDYVTKGGVQARLPFKFTVLALALIAHMEIRFHFHTVSAWWFRRSLRSTSEFIDKQRLLCQLLLSSDAPSLERIVFTAVENSEGVHGFAICRAPSP